MSLFAEFSIFLRFLTSFGTFNHVWLYNAMTQCVKMFQSGIKSGLSSGRCVPLVWFWGRALV